MKIYLKLYFWFLLVFIMTLLTVALLAAQFYGSRIHEELREQALLHAKFLEEEYLEACSSDRSSVQCREFLIRVKKIPLVRFWVVDPKGIVLNSTEAVQPRIMQKDLDKAKAGENVMTFRRHSPFQAILPVRSPSGNIDQLLVFERGINRKRRFPGIPLLGSLVISGIVIGLLVLPLSLRLTKPIRKLHSLGQEWAEGRLEKRAALKGEDEIAQLGSVFNQMAANLERILQQRKEFLALISHELKSPLARMKIALELVQEKGNSPTERASLIETIQREITESEKLIEQLLVLSSVEMGATDFREFNAASFLQRAANQVEPLAKNARVSVEIKSDAPILYGDETNLYRAVVNVLENAIKFSPPGGSVQLRSELNEEYVTIECKDSGPGIPEKDQQKIFEPFYRGVHSDKEGSGLGLFIARRIMELHQGTIQASSDLNSGAMIVLRLPIKPKASFASQNPGN